MAAAAVVKLVNDTSRRFANATDAARCSLILSLWGGFTQGLGSKLSSTSRYSGGLKGDNRA